MSNPFIELKKIYTKSVKKADKNNTAELYKEAFLYSQKLLKEEYHTELLNIEYLDGYFIFGSGTNSIVHFNVNGCKNWKWGVWWSYDAEKEYNQLHGEFFCQHERYLEKFKPSRGTYNEDVYFTIKDGHIEEDNYEYGLCRMSKICHFIHKNPYIAAMVDFKGCDYSMERQHPISAFFEYYWTGIKKKYNEAMSDFLNSKLGMQSWIVQP